MVPIVLTLPVISIGDSLNNIPSHLHIELSDFLIARLQKMQRIIKRNKFDVISEYNGDPQYLIYNTSTKIYTKSTYSYEAEALHVKATHCYWTANIKFSRTSVTSGGIHFEDLNKILKIRKLPIIEMPKYINDCDPIIQHLAKIRMEANE